jgi:hypothetical protein
MGTKTYRPDFMCFSSPDFFCILEIRYFAVPVMKYNIACTDVPVDVLMLMHDSETLLHLSKE